MKRSRILLIAALAALLAGGWYVAMRGGVGAMVGGVVGVGVEGGGGMGRPRGRRGGGRRAFGVPILDVQEAQA